MCILVPHCEIQEKPNVKKKKTFKRKGGHQDVRQVWQPGGMLKKRRKRKNAFFAPVSLTFKTPIKDFLFRNMHWSYFGEYQSKGDITWEWLWWQNT